MQETEGRSFQMGMKKIKKRGESAEEKLPLSGYKIMRGLNCEGSRAFGIKFRWCLGVKKRKQDIIVVFSIWYDTYKGKYNDECRIIASKTAQRLITGTDLVEPPL